MAELQIRLADGKIRKRSLGDRPILIGRDPSCDIALVDEAVSREHAVIRSVGDEFHVKDLQSSNGTWLNGCRITSGVLRHGDVITIHEVRIRFCEPGRGASAVSVTVADVPGHHDAVTIAGPHQQPSIPLRRLEMIYELSARLTSLRDADELLEDALEICFETFGFERGAIGLCRADGESLDWRVVRDVRGARGELTVSQTILRRALQDRQRSILNDDQERSTARSDSIARLGIRSAMCVPLMVEDRVLGAIYGDRSTAGAVYTAEDVDFLFGLARQVSIGLLNATLVEEQHRKLKLENEINLARETQEFLFPTNLPDRNDLKVQAFNLPGARISGDYYDVIELEGGRLGLVIADVTGKGVAASLLMANLQGTVRATLAASRHPAEALALWNNLTHHNTEGLKFITTLLGILDPRSRTLQLAAAGHPPPYLITLDPPSCLVTGVKVGLPLGIEPDAVYSGTTVDLPAAPCALFLYTDGVTEAMNAQWEEFDRERLEQALRSCSALDPDRLLVEVHKAIRKHVGDAPQNDDITMLAVQIRGV